MASKESVSHVHGLDTATRGRRAQAVDDLVKLAYEDSPGSDYKIYKSGNAFAISKQCHFAFRGTDDMQDVLADFNIDTDASYWDTFWNSFTPATTSKLSAHHEVDFEMHEGFVKEWNKLRELMREDIYQCLPDAVFMGHSLGGAMATVAYEDFGRHGTVYTFGAPRPYYWIAPGGCRVEGLRMWHESDPVPIIPKMYVHAQSSLKLIECTGYPWDIFSCEDTWVWTEESCDASATASVRYSKHYMALYREHYHGDDIRYGTPTPTPTSGTGNGSGYGSYGCY